MATNFWLFYSHILVSVTLVETGRGKGQVTVLEFYTPCNVSTTAKARDFKFCKQVGQFLRCGLRKFSHSKSSVYTWYPQFDRRRFVYDTYRTIWKRLDRVMVECTCLLHSGPLQPSNFITSICSGLVVQVVSALLRGNWKDFNWHDASGGSSAIAELLVKILSLSDSVVNLQQVYI